MTGVATQAAAVARSGLSNLHATFLVTFGRGRALQDVQGSPVQVLLSFAVLWLVLVAGEYALAGRGAEFWSWGLVADIAAIHLWLLALLLVVWFHRAWRQAGAVLVVALASTAGISAFVYGVVAAGGDRILDDVLPGHDLLLWSSLAWIALVWLAVSGQLDSRPAWWRRGFSTCFYAASLAAISYGLPRPAMFYIPAEAPDAIDVETTYYRQGALVEAQFEQLLAPASNRINMYYLGVAPFASEDVFLRETRAAQAIVEQRLGLTGRTVSLVNHRDTLEALPLANLPNLRHTLQRLADTINRNEDIVFLYLTSHGYEDASLAAEFEDLVPNEIDAPSLRQALDDAGILWRVVVISACFSGSFIEQLRSSTTLLVTAAAADRSSFGCAHENEWTYFGEAFFEQALAQTTDLLRAAELARDHIAAREAEEDKAPSRPQIVVGERIGTQLDRWRNQLETGG